MKNNIYLDGEGNVILQDISGSTVTVNINKHEEVIDLLNNFPKQIVTLLEEKLLNEKEDLNIPQIEFKISVYKSKLIDMWLSSETSKMYVSQKSLGDGKDTEDTLNYIVEKSNDSFLILGNSGLGKSTLLLNYAYGRAKDNTDTNNLPIYYSLSSATSIEDISSIIVESFSEFRISLSQNEIDYLINTFQIELILVSSQ